MPRRGINVFQAIRIAQNRNRRRRIRRNPDLIEEVPNQPPHIRRRLENELEDDRELELHRELEDDRELEVPRRRGRELIEEEEEEEVLAVQPPRRRRRRRSANVLQIVRRNEIRRERQRRRRAREREEANDDDDDDDDNEPPQQQQQQEEQQPQQQQQHQQDNNRAVERGRVTFRQRLYNIINRDGVNTALTLFNNLDSPINRLLSSQDEPGRLPNSINRTATITFPAGGDRHRGDLIYSVVYLAVYLVHSIYNPIIMNGPNIPPSYHLNITYRGRVNNVHHIETRKREPQDVRIRNLNHDAADLYNIIVANLMADFEGTNEAEIWSGVSIDSLDDFVRGDSELRISVSILIQPGIGLRMGNSFTEDINKEIHDLYGEHNVLVPRNADNACVWYALGISYLYYICCKTGSERTACFTGNERKNGISIDMLKIKLAAKRGDPKIENVLRVISHGEREFEQDVMKYGRGVFDGRLMSLKEGMQFFDKALEVLVEDEEERKNLCLQVYILRAKANGEITLFPAYMGPCRSGDNNVFVVVNYISEKNNSAHYIVPSSLEHRFGKPGKVKTEFWVCSECGLICFTRSVLLHHVHERPGGGLKYGWNDRQTCEEASRGDGSEIFAEGHCFTCRLSFDTTYAFRYHCDPALGGCFTSSHVGRNGLRGYRHVQFSRNRDLLEGIDCDDDSRYMDTENADVRAYADFESVIDPTRDNEHRLLYWGLWVESSSAPSINQRYSDGRSITEFFDLLVRLVPPEPEKKRMIVWFHNGSGYDFNFIFKELMNNVAYKDWRLGGILRGANKWQQLKITLPDNDRMKGFQIIFKDTYQFLTLSLAKLVACSKSDPSVFVKYHRQLQEHYGADRMTAPMCEVVTQKNSLPYTYFTDESKLDAPMSEIMDTLSVEEQGVARALDFTTVGEWLRLYLMSDVLLLRCVFERARMQLRSTHHVLFDRYVGLPSTTWHAWIKSLAQLPESERPRIPMYNSDTEALFFKRMVRGGVTCASKRYAVSDAEHTILYLDVNGLYPHVMRRKYPAGQLYFTPVMQSMMDGVGAESAHDFVRKVCEMWKRGEKYANGLYAGGAFEVDMHVPAEYHDELSQFPLAPEHVNITEDVYEDNEYLNTTAECGEDGPAARKNGFHGLACTLWPKKRYQVHWRVLLWYIRHGMNVDKVHCMVLWTEERAYLKDYVEMNMRLRDEHRDELTRTLYKLMGNALYGKTFENPFNHTGVSVVGSEMKLYGLLEQGRVHSIIYTGDNGSLVVNEGERVILDKPTYIGAIVLEYAKLHMYKLFYEKLARAFSISAGELELLYTDTDSFVVRVRHSPEMRPAGTTDISRILEYINQRQRDAGKKDVIGIAGGLTKSETGEGDYIEEFCALRAKCYAYRTALGKTDVRAKGTTHEAQKRELHLERYKEVLRKNGVLCVENQRIARTHFELHSVTQVRVALSANDGKRWICANGVDTLPFGHYMLDAQTY